MRAQSNVWTQVEETSLSHASVPQESNCAGRQWGIEERSFQLALRGDCPEALPDNSDFGLCTSATSAS